MPVLPIDIQTMMGQMENVGKAQQKIENQPLNQQQSSGNVIHKQTDQQTHQVTNLQHTDIEDKKVDPDRENRREQERPGNRNKKEKKEEGKQPALFLKDPDKGNIIDVKK